MLFKESQTKGRLSSFRGWAKLRTMAVSLTLLAAAVFLTFLVLEGAARWAFPEWAPRSARLTKFWQYDEKLGWKHVPGAIGRFSSYGFDTVVQINSHGFRGPERDYVRDGEVGRVLVLGDSMTFGFGVEYEEMFTTILERQLPNIEIINLGVSGYSTDQELLLYQSIGRKYGADVVIVVVAGNDFSANARTVESIIYGKPMFVSKHGTLELVNQPVARAPWWKYAFVHLSWRSYVLTKVHRVLFQLTSKRLIRFPPTDRPSGVGPASAPFLQTKGQAMTARLSMEFKEVTSKDGANLMLVFVGGLQAKKMSEYLALFDIDSLVLEKYLDSNESALYLYDRVHWSPNGHRIVADVLADRLRVLLHRLNTEN